MSLCHYPFKEVEGILFLVSILELILIFSIKFLKKTGNNLLAYQPTEDKGGEGGSNYLIWGPRKSLNHFKACKCLFYYFLFLS